MEPVEDKNKRKKPVTAIGPLFFAKLALDELEIITFEPSSFTRSTYIEKRWQGLCVIQSTIYFFGYKEDPLAVSECKVIYKGRYVGTKFVPRKSMKLLKDGIMAYAVHDKLIYVFGSANYRTVAEKYDILSNSWSVSPYVKLNERHHIFTFQSRYLYALNYCGKCWKIYKLDTLDEESGWSGMTLSGNTWDFKTRLYAIVQESPYRVNLGGNTFTGYLDIQQDELTIKRERKGQDHCGLYSHSNAIKGIIYFNEWKGVWKYSLVRRAYIGIN